MHRAGPYVFQTGSLRAFNTNFDREIALNTLLGRFGRKARGKTGFSLNLPLIRAGSGFFYFLHFLEPSVLSLVDSFCSHERVFQATKFIFSIFWEFSVAY